MLVSEKDFSIHVKMAVFSSHFLLSLRMLNVGPTYDLVVT